LILKTYARVVTGDMEVTLDVLRALTGKELDLRFKVAEVEIAAIGDFCVVAAPTEQHKALREIVGPVIVDDLDQTRACLLGQGAVVVQDRFDAPTGSVLYARNKDGVVVEWLEFSAEYLLKFSL